MTLIRSERSDFFGKGKVRDEFELYLGDEFDGLCLSKLRERIDEMIKEYGEDAQMNIGLEYHPYSEEQYVKYSVTKIRDETDEERQEREHRDQLREAKIEQREQEEFERLAKKFGKNS